jgi:hypothetical protein
MKKIYLNTGLVIQQLLTLGLILAVALPGDSHATSLTLANVPLQSATTSSVKPNVMFMLDDSGSMDWDYMPDDSKNFSGKYGFNSSHCNGVYYNPNITYTPPVDATGKSFGDPTSASYVNNSFTAAYVDGYDTTQGTVDLDTQFTGGSGTGQSGYTSYSGHPFYYVYSGTQTATWQQQFHNTNSIFYKECASSIGATTKVDGTNPVNTVFTKVTLASTETTTITVNNPSSGSATNTVVSGITVNGIQLMSSASDTSGTGSTSTTTVASQVAAKINLSGFAATSSGNVVTITGPTSAMGYAPVITTSKGNLTFVTNQFPDTNPAHLQNFATWYTYYSTRMMMMKTGVGLAFEPVGSTYRVGFMTMNNNVPPDFLDIHTFNATQKSSWYSMLYAAQAGNSTPLREALSHVGQLYAHKFGATTYYKATITVSGSGATTVSSVNVGGTQLMAGSTTSSTSTRTVASQIASQINLLNTAWGASASNNVVTLTAPDGTTSGDVPSITSSGGMTITATALAPVVVNAQLNGVTPVDPIQYSCQQNFVILSTDGYWNGPTDYNLSNGLVGNQDGTAPRPMYDGSTWNMTTSQIYQSQTQIQQTTSQLQKKTTQLQSSTSTLQSQTSQLQQQVNYLQSQTSQLQSQTSQLQSQTTQLQASTSTLQGTVGKVLMSCGHKASTCGSAPSSGTPNSNWSVVTSCTSGTYNQCAVVVPSPTLVLNVTSKCNTGATISSSGSTYTATNSDAGYVYGSCSYSSWSAGSGVSSCTAVNQSSTPNNTSVLTATQCNSVVTSPYANVSSCSATTTPNSSGNTTQCQYTAWSSWAATSSCTAKAQSSGPNYSVGTATNCQIVVTSPFTNASACTATTTPNSSGNTTQCQYTSGSWTGVSSCTPVAQSTGPNYTVGTAKNCQTVVTSPYANVSLCTVTTTPDSSGNTTQCRYSAWGAWTNASSCAPVAQSAGPTTYTVATATQCQELCNGATESTPFTCTTYVGAASCTNSGPTNGQTVYCPNPNPVVNTTYVASCTPQTASSSNNYVSISCQTNTLQSPTVVASCTPATASSANNYVTTTCTTQTLSTQSNVASCIAGNSGAPNYIQTSCTVGSGGTSDTLADVAMYYYQTDLRTPALGNCTGALGAGIDVCANNVFTTPQDNNQQQHMTTYTVGIGTRGNMVYTSSNYMNDTSGDFYSVKTGQTADSTQTPPICSWQSNGTTCNWPIPVSNSYNNIDDLWHAAVDGRGTYYAATDPADLSSGLSNALSSITARIGTGAAAATSTLNPVAGNNYAYVASYTTVNWTGNLEARTINTITGAISDTDTWSVENVAADTCPAPSTVVSSNSGNSTVYNCVTPNVASASNCASPGVYDPVALTCSVQMNLASNGTLPQMVSSTSDTRTIYTANSAGTGFVPFYYSNLTSTQQAYFNAPAISSLSQWASLTTSQQTAAQGANLVNYLRGQYAYDNRATNAVSNQLFRTRLAVMGDAIDSQPSFIAAPTFSYADSGYSAFVSANLSRAGTVYIGTNDGMLHAFNGTTGIEDWAFVPKMVIPNLYKLADVNYSINHAYFVDGSPIISDFYCTSNCPGGSTPSWRTILVGGLNAGGREFYALDITDPANPALLWEFTPAQDADLGYSYGLPIVTKLSNGTWVVVVTSGYDNGTLSGDGSTSNSPAGDGVGYLYVLDARSGTIISKLSTGVGSPSSPSGLGRIAAWNSAPSSNQASYIYGGDLLGNIWRFDINGGAVFKMATLMDASGNVQPIMTTPTLGQIDGERVVFVGTGQYLQTTDLSTTQVQSLYAISDNSTTTFVDPRAYTKPTGSTTPGQMVQQTITENGTSSRTGSSNPVDFNIDRGWYLDFPDSGERENVDSQLVQGTLIVPTIVPSNTVCAPGGYGWLNYFDYASGSPVPVNLSTQNGAVNTNVSVQYTSPVVGINVLYIGGSPIVEVVNANNPTPQVNNNVPIETGTSNFQGTRVQWRELIP